MSQIACLAPNFFLSELNLRSALVTASTNAKWGSKAWRSSRQQSL